MTARAHQTQRQKKEKKKKPTKNKKVVILADDVKSSNRPFSSLITEPARDPE